MADKPNFFELTALDAILAMKLRTMESISPKEIKNLIGKFETISEEKTAEKKLLNDQSEQSKNLLTPITDALTELTKLQFVSPEQYHHIEEEVRQARKTVTKAAAPSVERKEEFELEIE